jgi:hypothetical protein
VSGRETPTPRSIAAAAICASAIAPFWFVDGVVRATVSTTSDELLPMSKTD